MKGSNYDGWSDYTVTVKPAFTGINLDISGDDRNGIKDYLSDVIGEALTSDYTPEE